MPARGANGRVVVLAGVLASVASAAAAETPEGYKRLVRDKPAIAAELAKTISRCVARRDTDHVAFHGCIDWHSSVHGTWALVAYAQATGDKRYDDQVAEALRPEKIAAERELLKTRTSFEMPYGRAWFLRLAIEYKTHTGSDVLEGMADEVLGSLLAYFRGRGVDPSSLSYNSASWALINMADYATFRGNAPAQAAIRGWITEHFAREGATCDPAVEHGHFMAVCTNWAWLASTVMEREAFRAWAERFFAKSGLPKPVTDPVNWHHHGLNFSRAWGLARIFAVTGEAKYAEAYLAHFEQSYDQPVRWRGSYEGVAHWVAQFGMFALQQAQ